MTRRPLALRLIAAAGTLLLLFALILLWMSRASIARSVYVSEMGASNMPTAGVFVWVLTLIALGASLVAVAGRDIRSSLRLLALWTPSVSLWVASGFFFVDSRVPCTPGCPVPVPGSVQFTWQDFVHTSAAVLAFAFASWAMLQCSFAVGYRALRRFSLVAAISVASISTAGGLMSLFNFYASVGSYFEFAATTIGLAWVLAFGVSLVFGRVTVRGARDEPGALPAQRDRELIGETP